MFVLARQAPIGRLSQPTTRVGRIGFPRPGVNHRFDGNRHPLAQAQAAAGFPVVGHHRVFVHRRADPVADKFAHVAVAVFIFRVVLDCRPDVTKPIAYLALVDPQVEGFFGDVHQFGNFRTRLAHYV